VTDLNGETRSATTIVNVGYHALLATMSLDGALDKNVSDQKITIDTRNLNGEFMPSSGVIKIHKLQAPNRVLRSRPWGAPDYQDFSEEAFKNLFPHDAYNDEHDSNNWKKGDLVFEKAFDTEKSKELALGNIKKWTSGEYIITLESTDKFGQLVKDEIKTTLYSADDKTLADNQLFSITTNKPSYKVGETAFITLASSAENLNVTITIEKAQKIIKTEVITLNNNKKTMSIPVDANDVGGFAINYSYAAFNSFQSGTQSISVPYPRTDLDTETTTFRDKLQPGTDETWSFKIKGTQGDKVSAELLASMYDASLDQFKSHSWDFNPTYKPMYYSNHHRNAYQSFGTKNFRVYNKPYPNTIHPQQYDQLNWFGFYFGNNHHIMMRGQASISKTLQDRVAGIQIEEESSSLDEAVVVGYGEMQKETSNVPPAPNSMEVKDEKPNFDTVQIRKNLQETAFFFPKLKTDKDGNVSFSFTTPEALTQWKLQLLAHTKTLESATKTLTTVTQKELMVNHNAPRFLHQVAQIR